MPLPLQTATESSFINKPPTLKENIDESHYDM